MREGNPRPYDTLIHSSRNFSRFRNEGKTSQKYLRMPRHKLRYYGIYGIAILGIVVLSLGL